MNEFSVVQQVEKCRAIGMLDLKDWGGEVVQTAVRSPARQCAIRPVRARDHPTDRPMNVIDLTPGIRRVISAK